jgi:hemoglobin/transferrin/lactoferrin receptor protein
MNTTLRRLALAASPLALTVAMHAAHAEEVDLGSMAVTARGYAAPLTQTPGGVAVADEETIFLTKKDSIADALATLPGISTSGDSAWGRDVSIRGMSGTSVVVLIDGKRINTATDVNARLGLINPMDVDRVEVLKGPVSALYGSGSTGGVINVITRKGKFTKDTGYHGRVGLSATTNGAGADAYGNLHYDGEDVWLLGSGGMRDHANFADGNGNDVRNSEFQDGQFRLAGGFKPTDRLTVELSALRADATDVGIPGGSSTLPSTARVTYPRTTNTLVSADATLDVGGENLKEVSGSLYYNVIERRVRLDQLPPPQGTANLYIEPAADHAPWAQVAGIGEFGDHTVVAGFDGWTDWTMNPAPPIPQERRGDRGQADPDARQTSLGLYAEDTMLSPPVTLTSAGASTGCTPATPTTPQ